ncbi:hypothetical protein [Streptomyces mobaraensis]|uniref:Integral membrane protein n=1 Tax=Streptomyces mobaraensis TaxID=35621 RepID=A0A5N5VZ22_STRMB|nr:hypothetical protein [Streptomyces mobaraensis]KAB7833518.1 hypothetical protein FRZ00_33250 [Streptomyces mobaraensis]
MLTRTAGRIAAAVVAVVLLTGSAAAAVADPADRVVAAPAIPCPVGPAGDYCRKYIETPAPSATPTATASPSPGSTDKPKQNSPCDLLRGTPAYQYCQDGDHPGGSPPSPVDDTLDPLSSLARGCASAASWIVDKLSAAVKETGSVDFTNSDFVRQYAICFAASSVLTIVLWLWAVMKRAIRGVPMTTAIGEAIGLLWLTVMASAFTPLVLYTLVSATDSVTAVLANDGNGSDKFFGGFAKALTAEHDNGIGGGPIMLIVASLVSVLAAGMLWLELVIRAALLYVGAALGTVVYAGLVDKDLWSRVRRWAGIMLAVILVKPIIVIVLGLASAITSGHQAPDALGAVVSGLAIIILTIMCSALVYRLVPGIGDEIVAARQSSYDHASRQAAAIVTSPTSLLRQGINTHGNSRDRAARAQPSSPGVSHASEGISAHAFRPPAPTTTPPPAPPAPRAAPPQPTRPQDPRVPYNPPSR